jgi:hypothetical protein
MPDKEVIKIRVRGSEYSLDPESLTWGEIEEMERYFERSFEEIELASGRGAMFIAYLAKRRVDLTTTLDELRALPMTEIEVVEESLPFDEAAESGLPSSEPSSE